MTSESINSKNVCSVSGPTKFTVSTDDAEVDGERMSSQPSQNPKFLSPSLSTRYWFLLVGG